MNFSLSKNSSERLNLQISHIISFLARKFQGCDIVGPYLFPDVHQAIQIMEFSESLRFCRFFVCCARECQSRKRLPCRDYFCLGQLLSSVKSSSRSKSRSDPRLLYLPYGKLYIIYLNSSAEEILEGALGLGV